METDVQKLLNKRKWTGAEVGRLCILSFLNDYKYAGQKHDPLFTQATLVKMAATLSDHNRQIYDQYVDLHNAIITEYYNARGIYQQALTGAAQIHLYLSELYSSEKFLCELEHMPVILTEEQFNEAYEKAKQELEKKRINPEETLIPTNEEIINQFTSCENVPNTSKRRIAILRESPTEKHKSPLCNIVCIRSLTPHRLEGLDEDGTSEKLKEIRNVSIENGLNYMEVFDAVIEHLAEAYKIPELTILRSLQTALKKRLNDLNNTIETLFNSLSGSEDEVRKKQEIVRRVFPPIDVNGYKLTPGQMNKLKREVKNPDIYVGGNMGNFLIRIMNDKQ